MRITCIALESVQYQTLNALMETTYGTGLQMTNNHEFRPDEAREADVLIIMAEKVNHFKEFFKLVHNPDIIGQKIILLFDSLSDTRASLAAAIGYETFYTGAPVSLLAEKILTDRKVMLKERTQSQKTKETGRDSARVICFFSPQGGCGKTLISAAYARALAAKGKKVLLAEFSPLSSIASLFDLPVQGNGLSRLTEYVKNPYADNREEAGVLLQRYDREGLMIDLLQGGTFMYYDQITGDDTGKLISWFREREHDHIVIDMTSDLSERNIAILHSADQICMVATPDVLSAVRHMQIRDLINTLGIMNKCRLIVNKATKGINFSIEDIEVELQYPLSAIVREDTGISFILNDNLPISALCATKLYKDIEKSLETPSANENLESRKKTRGLFTALRRRRDK